MAKVNLDALIQREDFTVDGGAGAQNLADKLKVSELVKGESFFYSSLRKPDFQRETSDWDKGKISSFIKSFIEGDLIPSIILWQAGQYTFVIDGAHRLSALIAWVNGDYGDGFISQSFFNHEIDSEQRRVADQTRRHVDREVGSYSSFMNAIKDPDNANPSILAIANKLGFLSLQLQWVTGSAEKAESSFFTINQKATPISDTEISLLKARKKPYAMASRAILRSGAGHKYWDSFDPVTQSEVEKLAKEINDNLFTPEMKTPVKTLDLPLAGKGYSSRTLPLIFDLVRLSNNVSEKEVSEDTDGKETIQYLKNVNKVIRRFTTTHPSSLGLHPAVYFYSEKGRYQPTAFMAWIEIVKDFERKGFFNKFTDMRERLEAALIEYKYFTNQVTLKYGSGLKGYLQLRDVYDKMIELVADEVDVANIGGQLKNNFSYLNVEYRGDQPQSKDFNENTKSEVFLKSALQSANKCRICNGYIHVKSISIDHVDRKEDGGIGVADNGQITHPYCNTTYKN
ncbi:GmrSD restriction endonuclease domain-containing protein [Shewanella halotolerans]|uniref:GmrSD restriction endonuclease domain-containing protein n=1 Tax=Shewanella halotolerans TaxID=2864204 RepID=UPI001C659BF3|nr:DUF262 domain-containing protein [Shewanella halotolerans]QYJ89154.1 HNH endonuclease [Shewanella halotolerans]